MKNKIITITKGLLLIGLFYILQIGWSILFSSILTNGSLIAINICLIGCDIFLAIFYGLIYHKRLKNDYQDFNDNYKEYLRKGLKYWLIGLIIMIVSNIIISITITSGISNNEAVNRELLDKFPYYAIVAMIISAPIVEELVFRMGFKEAFKNKWVYAIFTGIIFAGAHVLNGISTWQELLYFIPYGSVGVSLGLALYDTDNIYTSIVVHGIHNTLTILQLIIIYSLMGL